MNFRSIFGALAFLIFLALANRLSAQIITNVTPPLGSHGDVVDVYGNGFAPGGMRPATFSADINGTVSTTSPLGVLSDSHIQLTNVPAGASSGYIHVFVNGIEAQSPKQFVVISTNSYVTNFAEIYGAAGTPVTITGVHFQTGGATNVMFNGILAQSHFVQSDNTIMATAPAGVTTGPLTVMSKFGTSHNFSTSNNVISAATNFFVAPSITSFSPANGRPNTNIVLTGVNFTAASAVTFGGVNALSFIVSNNTTILATVPTNASTAAMIVSPPSGTILSSAQSSTSFKMLPTIYALSPGLGVAGTTVTISGAGLNEKTSHPDVTVGGGVVATFGTISPTALSFNVPATAVSGVITITTTNGSISSTQLFYLPASITSFTPTNGGAGTIVQFSGNNFTNASAVSFNGIPASNFGVGNNLSLGATAPPGVTSGIISITTPFGTTNTATLFYVAPTITSFTPTHGLAGTTVTITGTSFTNASAVSFNGTPATSFTVINNSNLTAVAPNGVTTGPITVTAPGGTGQSVGNFTVDSADVAVTITAAPDPVFVGSNLVYTVIVTNSGPVAALNVSLSDTLPASVGLKSAVTSQGTLATNFNPIGASLGSINNNSSATVTLTVTPMASGSITNLASVTTDSLDPNLDNNNFALVSTVWPLPFLSITNLMSNGLMRVSWPAPLSGFTLQFKGDLSPGVSWTTDTGAKVVSGTNVSVIETNIGTARFFRLTN